MKIPCSLNCKEPCTIMGVAMNFDISACGLYDEHGLWGNAFARASNMSVLAACHRIEGIDLTLANCGAYCENPTQALVRESLSKDLQGRYTGEQIVEMLTQWYTSFRSARLAAERETTASRVTGNRSIMTSLWSTQPCTAVQSLQGTIL